MDSPIVVAATQVGPQRGIEQYEQCDLTGGEDGYEECGDPVENVGSVVEHDVGNSDVDLENVGHNVENAEGGKKKVGGSFLFSINLSTIHADEEQNRETPDRNNLNEMTIKRQRQILRYLLCCTCMTRNDIVSLYMFL